MVRIPTRYARRWTPPKPWKPCGDPSSTLRRKTEKKSGKKVQIPDSGRIGEIGENREKHTKCPNTRYARRWTRSITIHLITQPNNESTITTAASYNIEAVDTSLARLRLALL